MSEHDNNKMSQAMPELDNNKMPELGTEKCQRRFPAMEEATEEAGNCEVQSSGGIRWEKIDLKRIRELPEEYWYLGNNSFVLHGYFKHQHLALGRNPSNPECIYFGVPGKKHREEELLAMVFGFYEFEPIESQEEAMGYWVSRLEIKLN